MVGLPVGLIVHMPMHVVYTCMSTKWVEAYSDVGRVREAKEVKGSQCCCFSYLGKFRMISRKVQNDFCNNLLCLTCWGKRYSTLGTNKQWPSSMGLTLISKTFLPRSCSFSSRFFSTNTSSLNSSTFVKLNFAGSGCWVRECMAWVKTVQSNPKFQIQSRTWGVLRILERSGWYWARKENWPRRTERGEVCFGSRKLSINV